MDAHTRIGDYEVLEELGCGGMGRVYRVRNVISERVEAMKVLLPDLIGRQDLAARFLREIKLLAALNHPNIAALRTALTADNQLVMIMEFVEGQTLAQRLEQGPIPIADAVNYVGQVLDALRYAHGQHIVHRDIKPANMMLTPAGVVKVTDFGIARQRDDQTITVAGATTGSLSYMSPEQINGQTTDARSDLYSVGISLYEMVTGQRPFQADNTFAVMVAHLKETPRPPIELLPSLGPELNEIILTSIAKDPNARFQSAEAFRETLAGNQGSMRAASAVPAGGMDDAGTRTRTALSTRIPAAMQSEASGVKVSPPPVVPPPVTRAGHPGLYMALGGLLLLVALIGTGLYLGLAEANPASRTETASPAALPVPPAEAPSPPAPAAGAPSSLPATESTPTPTPPIETATAPPAPPDSATSPPAGRSAPLAPAPPVPSANAKTTNPPGMRAVSPSQPVEAARETASEANAQPPATAQPAVDFDQLEEELDQLLLRAAVVNRSLDTLEQAQARQGLGLRGETALRRESMNLNLTRAREAIDQRNAPRVQRFKGLAQSDVEALERFLGR